MERGLGFLSTGPTAGDRKAVNIQCQQRPRSAVPLSIERPAEATLCPNCQSSDHDDFGPCCGIAELLADKTPPVIRQIAEQLRCSQLVKCNHCLMRFRSPQLSADDLTRLYQNLPSTIWKYDPASVGSWTMAKRHLLSRYRSDDSISVLDVGAFDGTFLKQLPAAWNKFAIEPSKVGQLELANTGVNLVSDFVENVPREGRCADGFDVVTLFDVFEHLADPAGTLERLAALVKPSGRLLISTCNADHWSWKRLKGQHWYLHSAQHLCFATPDFFRSWGKANGMPLETIHQHPHQIASLTQQAKQSIEVVHAWARATKRPYLVRAIQMVPGFRHLAHKQGVVFANALHDHQLAIFQRPESHPQ